jgi:hypothetical protein
MHGAYSFKMKSDILIRFAVCKCSVQNKDDSLLEAGTLI